MGRQPERGGTTQVDKGAASRPAAQTRGHRVHGLSPSSTPASHRAWGSGGA